MTASNIRMHLVLTILPLTLIQGHTDQNHENNNCLIISEIVQAMAFKFDVKIVGLKVDMTVGSPMTLLLIQGHKFVDLNLDYFLICNNYIG